LVWRELRVGLEGVRDFCLEMVEICLEYDGWLYLRTSSLFWFRRLFIFFRPFYKGNLQQIQVLDSSVFFFRKRSSLATNSITKLPVLKVTMHSFRHVAFEVAIREWPRFAEINLGKVCRFHFLIEI